MALAEMALSFYEVPSDRAGDDAERSDE